MVFDKSTRQKSYQRFARYRSRAADVIVLSFRRHFPKTPVLKSKVVRGNISSLFQNTGAYQLTPEINDGELLITGFPDQRLFAINENEFSLQLIMNLAFFETTREK